VKITFRMNNIVLTSYSINILYYNVYLLCIPIITVCQYNIIRRGYKFYLKEITNTINVVFCLNSISITVLKKLNISNFLIAFRVNMLYEVSRNYLVCV